jgi:hypothetical protein
MLEEQPMKSRIAIAISALTLGTALGAAPSFAQTRSNGPEVQQESTGTVPQQEAKGCVHFQQGCSDKPYPMAQSASPKSERTSGVRTRVSERAGLNGSARVSERRPASDEYLRSAAPEPRGAGERVAGREGTSGETYGFGEQRRYYDYAPGAQFAPAARGGTGYCEMRFRSFDPATGTYMGFDGIRHRCP